MEIEFKLRVEECPSCNKYMMQEARRGVFPYFIDLAQKTQMKNKDIHFISVSEIKNQKICSKCEKDGKASFVCALCNETKDSNQVEESFGDPPEHLCTDCYAKTPVKTWDEKVAELEKSHRYDFE